MEKDLTRNLGLGGIGLYIVGIILAVVSKNLAAVGLAAFGIGGILIFISYVGALIKSAQLSRWGWFVGILLTGGIGWLIYIFAGPTTKNLA